MSMNTRIIFTCDSGKGGVCGTSVSPSGLIVVLCTDWFLQAY